MQKLQDRIAFSKKARWLQLFVSPIRVLQYLFWTRLALLLNRPIPGEAKFFFGEKISGFFPEPVFSYIYLYGFFEDSLTQIICQYLKKGMVFLDVGSHIGDFSMLASTLVGSQGKVYAFEPTPSTYDILLKNVKIASNVFTNPVAVWSKSTKMDFRDYGHFYSGCNSYTEARLPDNYLKKIKPKHITVQTINLDEFCKQNNIRPDFIKIDAESAEYQVLQGMKDILSKAKPVISIEIGDKEISTKDGTKDCIKFMQKNGYTAYDIDNGKIRRHKIRPNYYLMYNNLLFLPNK